MTTHIHWIGAGLSSGPGIVSLANKYKHITVWDICPDNAKKLKQHCNEDVIFTIRLLDLGDEKSILAFCESLKAKDIIVSMLPAAFHVMVAKLAIENDCHLVTSSYLSEEMNALNDMALDKGLSIVNEVGLDPGIDHLFTHLLVTAARENGMLGQGHTIDFISYCGGIPAERTDFTYKFSWTPLGVLIALTNPAQLIKNGQKHSISKAWEEVSQLVIENENFEVYPNRDSIPYIEEYGLKAEQNIRTFVRGTLRQDGWKKAWKDILTTLETASMDDLKKLSDQLLSEHSYARDEEDRVVLHVAMSIHDTTGELWSGALSLDQKGTGWKSAMASCVSLTVAEAVSAIINGKLGSGVQPAPHELTKVRHWLKNLKENGLNITSKNVTL